MIATPPPSTPFCWTNAVIARCVVVISSESTSNSSSLQISTCVLLCETTVKRRDLSTAPVQLRFVRPVTPVPPLSLCLGLLYGLDSLRTLSSIIGTRVWTIVKIRLWVAGRKFCLRSQRTLSLRDPTVERRTARNLVKKSNNVTEKLGVGKFFNCFIKDNSWRLGMRFQNLIKHN